MSEDNNFGNVSNSTTAPIPAPAAPQPQDGLEQELQRIIASQIAPGPHEGLIADLAYFIRTKLAQQQEACVQLETDLNHEIESIQFQYEALQDKLAQSAEEARRGALEEARASFAKEFLPLTHRQIEGRLRALASAGKQAGE